MSIDMIIIDIERSYGYNVAYVVSSLELLTIYEFLMRNE